MWWSRTFLLLILLGLGPAGCGFRPMYAGSGTSDDRLDADLARVQVDQVPNRVGQQLRNALVQRLSPRGEAVGSDYSLVIEMGESVSSLGYRKDTYATVGNLILTANVRLNKAGVILMSKTVSSTVYFDYVGPRYASIAMERDGEDRAVSQLADEIRNSVAVAIQRYKADPTNEIYTRRTPFLDDQPRRPPGRDDSMTRDRP